MPEWTALQRTGFLVRGSVRTCCSLSHPIVSHSSDRVYSSVLMLCRLLVAIAVAGIWTRARSRRREYRTLH